MTIQDEMQKMSLDNKILKELATQQVMYDCCFPRGAFYKGFALNDDLAPALRYSCFELDVPLEKLKKSMRELRNAGLVELVPTIDSVEEKPCGSGWFLTQKGLEFVVDANIIDENY